jgi:heme exporter protein CcmD
MMLHFGGRHAAFVWAAYAVTAPVLAGLVVDTLLKARRWRRAAERPPSTGDQPPA